MKKLAVILFVVPFAHYFSNKQITTLSPILYWENKIGFYEGQNDVYGEVLQTGCFGNLVACEYGYLIDHIDPVYDGSWNVISFSVKIMPGGIPYPPDTIIYRY